jgi:hypothetical protein
VGGLAGAAGTPLFATISPPPPIGLFVLIALLILVLLGVGGFFFARLGGTLTLTTVDDVSREPLPLPRRPWTSAGTDSLIGIPGTITVRGMPISKRMRIRLRLAHRPEGVGSLAEGGRTMLAGIDIVHDPGQVPAGAGKGYR